MARGFLYLVVIMNRHGRYVVAWRLSNTLETGFCADALGHALNQGTPEVFNTDQESQFTSREFTQILQDHSVRTSMDRRGRYQDNIFVERLWRTVKYEEVYLKAYASGIEARLGLRKHASSTTIRDSIWLWATGPSRNVLRGGECADGGV